MKGKRHGKGKEYDYIFLGTKKYPNASEFDDFLNLNSGFSNANTSLDHTNYHFDISNDQLEKGMDMFSESIVELLVFEELLIFIELLRFVELFKFKRMPFCWKENTINIINNNILDIYLLI